MESETESNEKSEKDLSFVVAYYQHQYQRIAEQESQRQTFTNIIVTLSIVALTFGFDSTQVFSRAVQIALLLVISAANLLAISYLKRTKYWIRTHRQRAKKALKSYGRDLYLLDKAALEDMKDEYEFGETGWLKWMYRQFGGRGRIQVWLHGLLFLVSLVLLILAVITP